MKVLVTGASGLIGSHLVSRLVETGHQVRALVRESSDTRSFDAARVEVARGDLCRPEDVRRAVDGCDLVFHLAVVRGDRQLNIDGAANVARAAAHARVSRVVFASSTRVYGLAATRPIDEETPVRPDSRHGRLKLAAEQILERCTGASTEVVIARLPLVLGPGGRAWRGVFDTVASGGFRWIGAGDNLYQPVDVADAAEGLRLCGTVSGIGGRVFILAGPEARTLRGMIATIERLVGVRTSSSSIPASALKAYMALNAVSLACAGRDLPRFNRVQLFIQNYTFNLSRARNELAYSARVGVDEMIERTVAWYCQQERLPAPGLKTAGARNAG